MFSNQYKSLAVICTSGRTIALLRCVACAICLVVGSAANSQGSPEVEELYEEALTYFYAGEIKSAHIIILNLLQKDREHIGGRLLQGRIDLVSGDGETAEESFQLARRFGASDELSLELLGEAYLMQRKFSTLYEEIHLGVRDRELEAAIHSLHGKAMLEEGKLIEADVQFAVATRLWPQSPEAIVGRAAVLLQKGDYESAKQLLNSAIRTSPEYPQSWYLLGRLSQLQGDQELALSSISRAIELDIYYIVARSARIAVLFSEDRDSEALEDIRFVLDIRPNDPQTNYHYALILARDGEMESSQLAMGRVSKALRDFGLEYVNNHPPSLFLYGITKFGEGDLSAAKYALTRYLTFQPNNPGARKLLGMLLLKEKNYSEVLRVVEPALEYSPEDPQILALVGNAYLQLKNTERATVFFEKAVSLAPFDQKIRTQLALTRLAVGKRRSAINELEEILDLDKSSTNVAIMLGFIYLRQGDTETALEWGERALDFDKKSSPAENLKGAAYLAADQKSKAKVSFKRSIANNPANSTARYNLAEIAMAEGDIEGARQQYEAVLEFNRREVRAMAELAQFAYQDGDIKEAINWYEKLRIAEPNAVLNQLQLLEIYIESGQPHEALSLASELQTRFPDHLQVLLAVGRANMANRDENGAVKAFRRMSLLAGHNSAELVRIARLQLSANDADGAFRSLEKALENNPDYLPALVLMAEFGARTGRVEQVLNYANQIQQKYPQEPMGYLLTGDALLREGRVDEAILIFEKGIANAPNRILHEALFRSRLRGAAGEVQALDSAFSQFESLINDSPDDFELRRLYADGHFQVGRYKAAISLYLQLLAEKPRDARLHNALAYTYLQLEDDRALDHANQAFALDPNSSDILDTYGWILHRADKSEQALPYLREAHQKSPHSNAVRYHLAAVLHQLGRDREARLQLEAAFNRGGEFDGIEEARSLLLSLQQ